MNHLNFLGSIQTITKCLKQNEIVIIIQIQTVVLQDLTYQYIYKI